MGITMTNERTILDAAVQHIPQAQFLIVPGNETFGPLGVTTDTSHSKAEVESVERFQLEPLRIRQSPTFETAEAFAAYVNDFSKDSSRAFASLADRKIVARIDYHTPDTPSWSTHHATFPATFDASFDAWMSIAGNPMGQRAFAEFLEDRAEDAVIPDPASLMEVAANFQAVRNVDFKTAINLSTGERQFRYEEKDSPAGAITCPKVIRLQTPVFYGTPPVDWAARFSYDISDGKLQFTVKIHRLNELLDREFEALVASLQAMLIATPIHRGKV